MQSAFRLQGESDGPGRYGLDGVGPLLEQHRSRARPTEWSCPATSPRGLLGADVGTDDWIGRRGAVGCERRWTIQP